ncbi:MAG: 4Fe-4S double cluster binding domain-containing protein [Bacillota bacterium]
MEREFTRSLRNLAKDLGADLFGVAQMNPARSLLGDELVDQFPRAVSIGVRLPGALVDQVRHGKHGLLTYVHQIYQTVNPVLNRCALILANTIEQYNFRALPVPASHTVDEDNLLGFVSHKCAAHLAGLGWIGPSCLLITPEHGPRVRLATILTDALLEVGSPLEDRCGDCDLCVKICPVSAFTGRRFSPDEPREVRFCAHACSDFSSKRRSEWNVSSGSICGLCVWVCPFGRSKQ